MSDVATRNVFKEKAPIVSMVNEERSVVYLNIVVLDPKEAVKYKIGQKIAESDLPETLKEWAGAAAPHIASGWTTPEFVAKVMGEKICEKIPQKMKERGLTVDIGEVFREGPYVVLELQVQHVDAVILAKTPKRQHKETEEDERIKTSCLPSRRWIARSIHCSFCLIGKVRQRHIETEYLPKIVQSKLESIMEEILARNLEERRVDAETTVLSEKKQARFFFDKLREIRAENKEDTQEIITFEVLTR